MNFPAQQSCQEMRDGFVPPEPPSPGAPATCVGAEEGGDGGLLGARLWEQHWGAFPLWNSGGCFELGAGGLREETSEKY